MQRHAESITIAAPPERIYDLVADLTGTGKLSTEARRVEWTGDPARPVPGARFRGRSRWQGFVWWRRGRVVQADRGDRFVFATDPGRGIYNDTTTWCYRFERLETGTTVVTESYTRRAPGWLRAMDAVLGRPKALEQGMRNTLANLKVAAERGADA
jgi:uncharacterized protein YndB with AHSA1/START domain